MLSNEIWNALCEYGKENYAPMIGRTYKDEKSGFVGVAKTYTLSGQLWLTNEDGFHMAWAKDCKEVNG